MYPECSCIVIICHGRSGSTLLRRILNTHSKIASPTEPWIFFNFNKLVNDNDFSSKALNNFLEEDKKKLLVNCIDTLIANRLDKEKKIIFIEKTPRNNEILDFIDYLYPNMRYIYLVRDFREILNSVIKRNKSFKSKLKKRLTFVFFKHINHMIKVQNNINMHISKIDKENLFVLKFDDLISETDLVLKNLLEWIGFEYEKNIKYYSKDDVVLGDKNSNMYIEPSKLNKSLWKKELLLIEKIYFNIFCKKINDETISIQTNYNI